MPELIINPNLTSQALIHIANCILFEIGYDKRYFLNSKESIEYYQVTDSDGNEHNLPFYVHTKKEISNYKQWEDEVDYYTYELEINATALLIPAAMSDLDLELEADFIKDKILEALYGDEKEVAEIYVLL